jgi:hypothetical protein
MKRGILATWMLLGLCGAARAQWTNPAAPYQQTGSGNGPSRNNTFGTYNLAWTSNGIECNTTGSYGSCPIEWWTQVSQIVYNGTITSGVSEVFFCNQMNYLSTSPFNQFNLCIHASFYIPSCPGITRQQIILCQNFPHGYWLGFAELDQVDGSINLTVLWRITLGYQAPNGSIVPFSGWLHMKSNVTGAQSCQTVSYTVGYSPDNVNWNNYTSPAVSCAGYSTTAAGFLVSAGNVRGATATVNIPSWTTGETNSVSVQTLYDQDVNDQDLGFFPPGQWCDTDGGVLSCVNNGTT